MAGWSISAEDKREGKKGPLRQGRRQTSETAGLREQVAKLRAQLEQEKKERKALETRLTEVAATSKLELAAISQKLDLEKREKNGFERQVDGTNNGKCILEKQLKDAAVEFTNNITALNRQLEVDRTEKQQLEDHLVHHLQAAGEEAIEEAVSIAVASTEMRYEKLKEEYEELAQRAQHEVNELNEQILAAQQQVMDIGKRFDCSEEARESLVQEKKALEASLMETSGERLELEQKRKELEVRVAKLQHSTIERDDSYELLNREAQRVTQELVKTKLELAELSEQHIIVRHELYLVKEEHIQLQHQTSKTETVASDQRRRRRRR